MKRNNYKKLAEEWFDKGDHDLSDAIILFHENGWSDTICFHCQQGVEKYLKGFLISQGKDPERTHILPDLLTECRKIDKDFEELDEECEILNKYYIDTRYPGGPPQDYPRKKAEEAIEMAEKTVKFIQKKCGIGL